MDTTKTDIVSIPLSEYEEMKTRIKNARTDWEKQEEKVNQAQRSYEKAYSDYSNKSSELFNVIRKLDAMETIVQEQSKAILNLSIALSNKKQ